jgi:Lrp/AsnC family transcriptional regulator, leucine-responsive regulatory protein
MYLKTTGCRSEVCKIIIFLLCRFSIDLLCFIEAIQQKCKCKFIKMIHSMPEVAEYYNSSGEFDVMLKVVTENMDAYDFHVNKLNQEENIGHVQSVFAMCIIKQTHMLVH